MQTDLEGGILRSEYIYQDEISQQKSPSLKELVNGQTHAFEFDPVFLELYSNGKDSWPRTPVRNIKKISVVPQEDEWRCDFLDCLQMTLRRNALHDNLNIALSGGLDSQFLVLLAKDLGYAVTTFYLKTEIPDYCEYRQVLDFCERFQIPLVEFTATQEDFLKLHPDFIQVVECPIYNLHPLSKFILAQKLAERGVTDIISGDGADQVLAGHVFCDLFFLSRQAFAASNVELVTPFATLNLQKWVQSKGPFLQKEPIRRLALDRWNLEIKDKKPTYFPEVYRNPSCLEMSLIYLREALCAE